VSAAGRQSQLLVVRAIIATVMMVMFAVMMSGRIVGTVLCNCSPGATEGQD
jgi:hypothetical protein